MGYHHLRSPCCYRTSRKIETQVGRVWSALLRNCEVLYQHPNSVLNASKLRLCHHFLRKPCDWQTHETIWNANLHPKSVYLSIFNELLKVSSCRRYKQETQAFLPACLPDAHQESRWTQTFRGSKCFIPPGYHLYSYAIQAPQQKPPPTASCLGRESLHRNARKEHRKKILNHTQRRDILQ